MLLCAAALVSCGQPKQQQKAVADVVTMVIRYSRAGMPIRKGSFMVIPIGFSRLGAMRMRSRLISTAFRPRIW